MTGVNSADRGILELMKLYSWNVNGIRSVAGKGLLEPFFAGEQPDVVCFQETKAHESQLDLAFPEYEKFWNSAAKKGYAGTAIWTKIPPVSVAYGLPKELVATYKLDSDAYGNPSDEGRVLTAEFDKFYLVTVYTPNSKRELTRLALRHEQWDPAFLEYVRQLEDKKPVYFCGDLNVAHTEIDLANPKPNVGKHGFTIEERNGFNAILAAGYTDTLRIFHPNEPNLYTWWTHWAKARERNVGWRIDYFLASKAGRAAVKTAAIHPDIMGSDHCPVSITIDEGKL
jgi:exodeoxyribonuclease-3